MQADASLAHRWSYEACGFRSRYAQLMYSLDLSLLIYIDPDGYWVELISNGKSLSETEKETTTDETTYRFVRNH
jgi:hypothetical protein